MISNMPPTNLIELLHDLTHPIPTIPFAYSRELLTRERRSHGGVMTMTMAMISPSPEANSASRLALRGRQRVAAAPRRRSIKRLLFRSFLNRRINRGQSRAPGGVGPTQEGRWRGQGLGRARHPLGCPLAALWPPFGWWKLPER